MQISANYSNFFTKMLLQSINYVPNYNWSGKQMYMKTNLTDEIIMEYVSINTNNEILGNINIKYYLNKVTPETNYKELVTIVANFVKDLTTELNEYNIEKDRFNSLTDIEKEKEIYSKRFDSITRYEPSL